MSRVTLALVVGSLALVISSGWAQTLELSWCSTSPVVLARILDADGHEITRVSSPAPRPRASEDGVLLVPPRPVLDLIVELQGLPELAPLRLMLANLLVDLPAWEDDERGWIRRVPGDTRRWIVGGHAGGASLRGAHRARDLAASLGNAGPVLVRLEPAEPFLVESPHPRDLPRSMREAIARRRNEAHPRDLPRSVSEAIARRRNEERPRALPQDPLIEELTWRIGFSTARAFGGDALALACRNGELELVRVRATHGPAELEQRYPAADAWHSTLVSTKYLEGIEPVLDACDRHASRPETSGARTAPRLAPLSLHVWSAHDGSSQLCWMPPQPEGDEEPPRYSLIRGQLSLLPRGYLGACRQRADAAPGPPWHLDPEFPDPGDGFYYIVETQSGLGISRAARSAPGRSRMGDRECSATMAEEAPRDASR